MNRTFLPSLSDYKRRGTRQPSPRLPGEALEPIAGDPPGVIILDLVSSGEESDVRQVVRGAQKGEGPALLGLVASEQTGQLDLALGLDDFILRGASTAEVLARIRQALWKKARIDTKNILKCGDLLMDLANYTVYVGGARWSLPLRNMSCCAS